MEEAAQILEIETFIPLLLQVTIKILTSLVCRFRNRTVNFDYLKTTATPWLETLCQA